VGEQILLSSTCGRKKQEKGASRGASASPLSYVPMTVFKVLIKRIAEIGDKSKRV